MIIITFIINNDNFITNFHFEVAPNLIDEEMLSLLRQMRPGLMQLEIGVQSTNAETLKAIHRPVIWDREKGSIENFPASSP